MGSYHISKILLCAFASCTVKSVECDNLTDHITSAMLGYSDWLLNNSFDPTTPLQTPVNISFVSDNFTLDCSISNLQVAGLSDIAPNGIIVTGDISQNMFSLNFFAGHLLFNGMYTLTGSAMDLPINGSGPWSKRITWYNYTLAVDSVDVTNGSNVDLSLTDFDDQIEFFFGDNIFNGLVANGYEKDVSQVLVNASSSAEPLVTAYKQLIVDPLHQYLQDYFKNEKLASDS